jgi:hypothetical protein
MPFGPPVLKQCSWAGWLPEGLRIPTSDRSAGTAISYSLRLLDRIFIPAVTAAFKATSNDWRRVVAVDHRRPDQHA